MPVARVERFERESPAGPPRRGGWGAGSALAHGPWQNQRASRREEEENSMNTLEAYNVSVDLIRELRTLVPLIEREDRDLGEQIRRAASSVCLNLGEGARSLKGN